MISCWGWTAYRTSSASYWLVYWRGRKTHLMDCNKPPCFLNTQINYRLGNQNRNLFCLPWALTHFSSGLMTNKQTSVWESRYNIELNSSMCICEHFFPSSLCHDCSVFFVHLLPESFSGFTDVHPCSDPTNTERMNTAVVWNETSIRLGKWPDVM